MIDAETLRRGDKRREERPDLLGCSLRRSLRLCASASKNSGALIEVLPRLLGFAQTEIRLAEKQVCARGLRGARSEQDDGAFQLDCGLLYAIERQQNATQFQMRAGGIRVAL
jgi:hypothetical protein